MGCNCGGTSSAERSASASARSAAIASGNRGSSAARWRVRRRNGTEVLFLNKAQADREAARYGVTAEEYSWP